ncbi:hypothetical protein MT325_m492L [Paramecium bursaria chlorella virus MT325]|uniref:Uncharacterized protein m492L n=1 Tax=Paramecium bursaria Chlorella virus MT325 TaxID=346932 RepID=A7IUM2_PBCVM|nr:hypothetical protein MT325_m492L [Paramecium bursaria chlorella virus MT325]
MVFTPFSIVLVITVSLAQSLVSWKSRRPRAHSTVIKFSFSSFVIWCLNFLYRAYRVLKRTGFEIAVMTHRLS